MSKRDAMRFEKLEGLEAEFRVLLRVCLHQCERGRWGLFGTFDHLGEDRRYWEWPEADRLRELAHSICEIRNEFGEHNDLCDEFLSYCAFHRANDPGEPTVAKMFLQKLESLSKNLEVST
jgi:hypothetical protein